MTREDGARNIGERRRYEDKIEVILNDIQRDVKELRIDIARNESEINDTRNEIKGLVTAWNTASNVATFLKWLAAVGMAVVFMYSLVGGRLLLVFGRFIH